MATKTKTKTKTTRPLGSGEATVAATPSDTLKPPHSLEALAAEASDAPSEAPKRRGRPPGSKNRPKVADDAPAVPDLPAGPFGAAIGLAFNVVGARVGEPDIWALTEEQQNEVDKMGQALWRRYAPQFLDAHPELVVFGVTMFALVGVRVVETRRRKAERKEVAGAAREGVVV